MAAYRVISTEEQRNLPPSVIRWMEEHKQIKGRHDFYWLEKQYLLLSLGYRPSLGYQLNICKSEHGKEGVNLIVEETTPQQGFVYPQIVVYPYLLLETKQPINIHLISANETSHLFQLK